MMVGSDLVLFCSTSIKRTAIEHSQLLRLSVIVTTVNRSQITSISNLVLVLNNCQLNKLQRKFTHTLLQVYSGQLKFSVTLENWPWANDGKFVDVDVNMKVPPGRAMTKKADKGRGHPVGFGLGADATAYFSSKVSIVTSHELVRLSITCI